MDERSPDLDNDALAHALSWLTFTTGASARPESLLSSQPLAAAWAPDEAVRALREAGYSAGLLQRPVAELHELLLPPCCCSTAADACIVVARHAGGGAYDIVMPGRQHHACTATEAELQAEYTGMALVCTPVPQMTASSDNAAGQAPLMRNAGSHWLSGARCAASCPTTAARSSRPCSATC